MSFLKQAWSKMGAAYRAEVGKRLASRGLLYEDLLVETADVKLALSRLPKDVLAAREQRLKRAMVLGSQQRYLPDEVAEKINPFEKYLAPYIEAVQEQKKEVRSPDRPRARAPTILLSWRACVVRLVSRRRISSVSECDAPRWRCSAAQVGSYATARQAQLARAQSTRKEEAAWARGAASLLGGSYDERCTEGRNQ